MIVKSWIQSAYFLPVAKTAGHYALALVAALSPQLGENHLLVAGLLACVFGPAAFVLSLMLNLDKRSAAEPFLDMTSVLVVVAFLPEYWHLGLIVGVVIALAPAMALNPNSYRNYASTATTLIVGMSAIAIYQDVSEWQLSILVLLAIFPPTILYAVSLNTKTEELRKQAEALSALQLVSGGIAHDFNNILTGISGYADIADSSDADSETTHRALRKILNATEKASLLTSQLVAYAGDKASQYEAVDIGKEIEGVVELVEGTLTGGIGFRVDLPNKPLYIYGDSIQFSRVMMNLLVNALEALDGAGMVSIKLRRVDGRIQINIEDTGTGIPQETLKGIFEPFVGSKSTGHGLGLAIVRNIVQQLHGKISVSSELGVGTKFTINLPELIVEESAPVMERESASGQSVLIADDEVAIRTILRRLLEDQGHTVIEAEDGLQFVELFRKHRSELCAVTLDIKMPGKNGWQCLEEVRKIDPSLPVVVLSGFDPHGRSERDAAMRFLSKPFRVSEFRDSLRELLETERLASANAKA